MGMLMSSMGGPGVEIVSKGLNMVTGTLYDRIIEKRQIRTFKEFQIAILDVYSAINMALPGKHYDAPKHDDMKNFYNKWKDCENDVDKKDIFTDFVMKNVNLSKADEYMMLSGIVMPPALMVAKRTGQSVPQLSVLKAIPDVAFVPGATILALIAVKLTKRFAFKDLPASFPQVDNSMLSLASQVNK